METAENDAKRLKEPEMSIYSDSVGILLSESDAPFTKFVGGALGPLVRNASKIYENLIYINNRSNRSFKAHALSGPVCRRTTENNTKKYSTLLPQQSRF